MSVSTKEVFEDIHRNRKWGFYEGTVSGPGSTITHTKILRKGLVDFMKKYEIKTLLDAPCGDRKWIQEIDFKSLNINYIGMDIVESIVEPLRWHNPGLDVKVGDITKDVLPQADAILVRDCLVHLPFTVVGEALDNIFNKSNIKYLITTTFPGVENTDIRTGEWRALDLEAWPFDLAKPMTYIADPYRPNLYQDKKLGVWKLR